MKHNFFLEHVLSVNTLDKTYLSQKAHRACIINCIMYEDQCWKNVPIYKVDKVLKMKFYKFFKDQMWKCLKHLVPKYLKPPSTQIS